MLFKISGQGRGLLFSFRPPVHENHFSAGHRQGEQSEGSSCCQSKGWTNKHEVDTFVGNIIFLDQHALHFESQLQWVSSKRRCTKEVGQVSFTSASHADRQK